MLLRQLQLEKFKGLMLVSSGVEFDKRDAAQSEILAQLEKCRRGEIEPWELEAARRSAVSSLKSMLDSQGRMEDFWLGPAVAPGGDRASEDAGWPSWSRSPREQVAAGGPAGLRTGQHLLPEGERRS